MFWPSQAHVLLCFIFPDQIRLQISFSKDPWLMWWSRSWCACLCVFARVCMWVLTQGNQSVWSCFWVFRVKDKGCKSCWRLCSCFASIQHGWVFYDTHTSTSRVRYSTWCGCKLKTASASTCSPPCILTHHLSALGPVGSIFSVRWCVFLCLGVKNGICLIVDTVLHIFMVPFSSELNVKDVLDLRSFQSNPKTKHLIDCLYQYILCFCCRAELRWNFRLLKRH